MFDIVTKIHALTKQGVPIGDITKLMINEQQQLMRKRMDPNDEKDQSIQTNVCIYLLHNCILSGQFTGGGLYTYILVAVHHL